MDLWATWCGPCVAAFPDLSELAATYAQQGVTVLAVSVDSEAEAARDFFEGSAEPPFVRAWAGPDTLTTVASNGIPAAFVLDADGSVVHYKLGYKPGSQELHVALDTVLAGE